MKFKPIRQLKSATKRIREIISDMVKDQWYAFTVDVSLQITEKGD